MFHNAKKSFQSEKTRNSLNKLGIYWESYHGVSIKVWCNAFKELNLKLGEAALKNNILKNQLYLTLIDHYQFDKVGQEKLNAALINSICSGWLNEGTSSFSLIDYKYPESKYKISYIRNILFAQIPPKIRG